MFRANRIRFTTVLLAALALPCPVTQAEFVWVEDFDALIPGPIDDQAGWTAADDTSVVTADPVNPDNQVLAVTTESTLLRRPLLISNGTVRMLFLRFQFGQQQAYSFGMSDSAYPDQFGDFESELGMTNATNDLRINDGGAYEELGTLIPNTWYNVWLFIDNINDTTQVYLHARPRDAARPTDLLDADGQTVFAFRDVTAGDLRTFFIKTGGGSSGNVGPLYIDDIYLEDTDALNLSNPTGQRCDADGDGDVDLDDYSFFTDCLNGPDQMPTPTQITPQACLEAFDTQYDQDVDLEDFSTFQESFSGL